MEKMAKTDACIDTDICVDFLRKKAPGFIFLPKLLERYEPCITAITAFELYLGHIKMKRKDRIDDFIAQFTILPFDLQAPVISAQIQASLDKRGEGIGIPDTLIAGICVAKDIPLLTLNTRHFLKVIELKLITI
jgi:tRNA(fMet)-specific endonuclease VapC